MDISFIRYLSVWRWWLQDMNPVLLFTHKWASREDLLILFLQYAEQWNRFTAEVYNIWVKYVMSKQESKESTMEVYKPIIHPDNQHERRRRRGGIGREKKGKAAIWAGIHIHGNIHIDSLTFWHIYTKQNKKQGENIDRWPIFKWYALRNRSSNELDGVLHLMVPYRIIWQWICLFDEHFHFLEWN